eukprot:1145107-Pelagomonas_calceolata.AAC.2
MHLQTQKTARTQGPSSHQDPGGLVAAHTDLAHIMPPMLSRIGDRMRLGWLPGAARHVGIAHTMPPMLSGIG